jgi:TolB-like protein
MLRQLSYVTRMIAVAATFALPAVSVAQDNRPVVVVFRFDNNSIGAGSGDFAGTQTGVQDLLITDLASNAKIRLVDRAHLAEILTEQGLTKTSQVDPATAVRLGKILGAQYAVTGGFMSDGKGAVVLTGRTIDIETTQIANPQKITGKTDNVLAVIAELSTKLSSNMNLAPKPGAGRRPDETGAKSAPSQSGTPTAASNKASSAAVETYAKPVSKPEAMRTVKLDVAGIKLYSTALDEMDKKNNAKAIALLTQVLEKYNGFEPAQRNLNKLQPKAGN